MAQIRLERLIYFLAIFLPLVGGESLGGGGGPGWAQIAPPITKKKE